MLQTSNSKILNFYNEHPSLNFENINILFIDILNNLFSEISPNVDNNFILTSLLNNFNKKITENNEIIKNELNNNVKNVINEITENNNKIIQQCVSESNKDINSSLVNTVKSQKEIDEKITQVLKKFDSSNKKGNMSEMFTYHLLRSMYPETQVKLVNTTKETGDILLVRDNLTIMFENKDYTNAVSQAEVNKFIRDLNVQQLSGIFISQNSSIVNKKEFEICFYGNNIGLYISNVNYNKNLIQIAIDTIDAIKSKMKEPDSDSESESESENLMITEEQLNIINDEYNLMINKKLKHIKTIKEYSKKLIEETESINIPTLFSILSENYGTNKSTEWKCTICNNFWGKNKGSLSSHVKAHERREKKILNIV